MNKIMIWSDFACPYCYIGEKRLEDALKELGWNDKFETSYKAFELNPQAPKTPSIESMTQLMAKKYQLSIGEAQERVDSIDAQGRDLGIDFRFGTAKSSNTFDAHRLMKLAEAKYDSETVEKLNKALFNAYFVKNLVLANEDVLLEIGLQAGLKEVDIERILHTDEFAKDVREDESQASALGIHGVPYIVFNNKYAIPGALSIDDFKRVLEEVFDKEPIKVTEKVESCNESGCSI